MSGGEAKEHRKRRIKKKSSVCFRKCYLIPTILFESDSIACIAPVIASLLFEEHLAGIIAFENPLKWLNGEEQRAEEGWAQWSEDEKKTKRNLMKISIHTKSYRQSIQTRQICPLPASLAFIFSHSCAGTRRRDFVDTKYTLWCLHKITVKTICKKKRGNSGNSSNRNYRGILQ